MSDAVKSRLIEIAASTGPLLRKRPWLHRRVHRVTFTPDGLARSHISIDFTVPEELPPFMTLEGERDVYFVPLMALRKWPPLMRMDLRDQHGEPFPLLTTPRNELIDGEALAAMAPEGKLREATVDILRRLPRADEQTAYKDIDALSRIVLNSANELDDEVRLQWRATLLTATSLASNLLLWARVDARKGERLIVKVAYEYPIETERRLSRRIFQSLSWAPMRLRVPVRDIGFGMSYHVQVELPPELAVHHADLRLYSSPEAERADMAAEPQGTHRMGNLAWAIRNTAAVRFERLSAPLQEQKAEVPASGEPYAWHDDDRAYLYVRDAESASGAARIELATSRRGLRPAAALMGAGTTAFLLVMTLLSSHVVQHTEATIAVLVVAPALLGYLVSPVGEHPLVRQRLSGVRALLAGVALCPVAAAASLISFETPETADILPCWGALTFLAFVLSALLWVSWLLPPVKELPEKRRTKPTREPPARDELAAEQTSTNGRVA